MRSLLIVSCHDDGGVFGETVSLLSCLSLCGPFILCCGAFSGISQAFAEGIFPYVAAIWCVCER